MENKKDDTYYLGRMLNIIEYIEIYKSNLSSKMRPNDQNSDAIVYKFIQLREEAKNLSKDLLDKNNTLNNHIKYLISFRNILTHNYDGLTYSFFDEIFDKDLPSLKNEIINLLN